MIIESKQQLDIYKEAGQVSKNILQSALLMAKPGVALIQIDEHIYDLMKENNVEPWFKDVDGYNMSSCISVNDAWIHGIPNEYIIKPNDIIKIDLGVRKDGLHVDNCWTIVASESKISDPFDHFVHTNTKVNDFLKKTLMRLNNAIDKAIVGNKVGDISNEMYQLEEMDNYYVIREYVGHGIGYQNWESPSIPCFGSANSGKKLKNDMVLAIEIMSSMGSSLTKVDDDNWTVRSLDNSLTAMFEHTVIVRENGPIVLTYI